MGKTKLDFRKLELEPTSSTKELLKNLESAQTLLEATEQDAARPSGLKGVARQLVSPGLVEHKSGAVRLWAATCLCEVLRVYAPRAPYGDDELLGVFGLLAASLRRHGQAGDGGRDAELTQDRVKRGRGRRWPRAGRRWPGWGQSARPCAHLAAVAQVQARR